MAVRAVVTIASVSKDQTTDNDLFTIHADIIVIGSNLGDLGDFRVQNFEVLDQDPSALAVTINNNVAAAVKTYLLSMNVPFGLLDSDTVRVLSSII